MKLRRRLRHIPEVFLAGLAYLLIPLLPRCAVVGLSRLLGSLGWWVSPRERRIALANLQLVYGTTLSDQERRRIGVRSFQSFALTALDLFWFSRRRHQRHRRYIQVDADSEAIITQSPLIGITGHIGNWEVVSTICGLYGKPMTAVAMPLKNAVVDRLLRRLRESTGSESVARKGAIRSLLRALKNERIIGLVIDQNTLPSEGGVWVPFFGLDVPVTSAPGVLHQRTGVPMVTAIAIADRRGVYRLIMSDRFPEDKPVEGNDVVDLTALATQQLETMIRQHPEHWLWSYKRWRYFTDPEDAARYPYYAQHFEASS